MRRQRDGARRAARQRGRAVGDAEAVGPCVVEVAAIERLGRRQRKEAMLAETLDAATIDLARPPRARRPGRSAARRVARTSRRSARCPARCRKPAANSSAPIQVTLPTPPMFTTASGCGRSRSESRVIDRDQRRALPACRHVGDAQIVDDTHTDGARAARRRRRSAR